MIKEIIKSEKFGLYAVWLVTSLFIHDLGFLLFSKEQMDIDWKWDLELDIEDIFLESWLWGLCCVVISWFPRKILWEIVRFIHKKV